MSASELRDLTEAELNKRLQDARQELFNLRLQRAAGKLLNPARVAAVRRSVAQLLTVMRERGAAAGSR